MGYVGGNGITGQAAAKKRLLLYREQVGFCSDSAWAVFSITAGTFLLAWATLLVLWLH